jgi:glutathione S-transferase
VLLCCILAQRLALRQSRVTRWLLGFTGCFMHVMYSFRRCPYAMRARLALHVSGVAYEHREVALKAKPVDMLAASPKGTVPVLCLASGEVLEQSLDIMHWALTQHDPHGWLPDSAKAKAKSDALIAANDGEFKANLDRYKYPQRFGLSDGLNHRELGSAWLSELDAQLQVSGYLSGERWGLADACVAPFVRQFARTERAWFDAQPWTHLSHWLSTFENSEAFAAIMHKHPLWVAR